MIYSTMNRCLVFSTNPRPAYWKVNAWNLNRSNFDGQGYENEAFIVWMRTAAMPTFKKLYAKISTNRSSPFDKGLPAGNYSLRINYS